MKEPLNEILAALDGIQLPSIIRPDIGPAGPPTLELVQFDLKAYAYSSIAYVRDLLNGLLLLETAENFFRLGPGDSWAVRMDHAGKLRRAEETASRFKRAISRSAEQ